MLGLLALLAGPAAAETYAEWVAGFANPVVEPGSGPGLRQPQ